MSFGRRHEGRIHLRRVHHGQGRLDGRRGRTEDLMHCKCRHDGLISRVQSSIRRKLNGDQRFVDTSDGCEGRDEHSLLREGCRDVDPGEGHVDGNCRRRCRH